MHKSKLIDRLRLVDRDELRDLSKFIESPSFNKDDKIVKLFDYMKKYHPVFDTKKLDRDYVVAKLFPEWKGNTYKKLSYIMSGLSQVIEDFFIWREIQEDQSERYHFLLKAYKRRKGDWFFDSTVEEFRKHLDGQPGRGTDYYFHQYRLNEEIYTHTATERVQTGINSFGNAINNLDLFYFAKKFMYSTEVRLRELYLAEKSELVLLDEMLETVKHPLFADNYFVQIFAKATLLYQTRDKNVYKELKKMVQNDNVKCSILEKMDMVTFANNFCILEYNRGSVEYLQEIFEWHKYGLEHKIWISKHMDHAIFYSIVTFACDLKKFEWADTFIKEYSKYLRDEVKESTKIMAFCRLEFSMKNFEKTLELLRDVEFVNTQYDLRARAYQLKCYYELDGYEMLFYDASNAFAQYCRRNKVIGEQSKTVNLNFISFIKRLHQAKYQRTEGKKSLLDKLEETAVLFSRWFKEKIENDIKDEFKVISYNKLLDEVDCIINLEFSDFDQDENVRSSNRSFSERVITGYNSEVDTSGNKTDVPIYETVEGTVRTNRVTRRSELELRVTVNGDRDDCKIQSRRLDEDFEEELEFYEIYGDERAIPSRFTRRNNDQFQDPDDVLEDLIDNLYRDFRRLFN